MRVRLAAIAALLLTACSDGPPGPLRVAVLDWDAEAGSYRLVPDTVTTLTALYRLRGDAATFVGGAEIVFDPDELDIAAQSGTLNTLQDIRDIVTKDAGAPPSASFTEARVGGEDGVLVGDDFDSLAMVTSYRHLERARLETLDLGLDPTCLEGVTTYYDVDYTSANGDDRSPERDNAAWYPLLQAFLVLPFETYREVPLAMNPGVMAHEYSHGIWNCVIEGNDPIPGLWYGLDDAGRAYYSAINEGLADFFGAAVTGQPDFLRASIPDADRDVSVERSYTQAMVNDATDEDGLYDPYALGSVVASALWRLRLDAGDPGAVARAAFRIMPRLASRILSLLDAGAAFDLGVFLEEAVLAFADEDPMDRPHACEVLESRFALVGPIRGCSG